VSVSALAAVRAVPGLERYLDLLEGRLEETVAAYPGRLGDIGADTLAAGGKRLAPPRLPLHANRRTRQ